MFDAFLSSTWLFRPEVFESYSIIILRRNCPDQGRPSPRGPHFTICQRTRVCLSQEICLQNEDYEHAASFQTSGDRGDTLVSKMSVKQNRMNFDLWCSAILALNWSRSVFFWILRTSASRSKYSEYFLSLCSSNSLLSRILFWIKISFS